MENLSEIMKLIEAGLQQDSTKVFNYTQLLIEKLETNGEKETAEKLRKIIRRSKTLNIKAQDYEQIWKLPVDTESRLPLAEIKQFQKDDIFISLNSNLSKDIQEFINLINNADSFLAKDIKIYRSMLLFGIPGTGKTQVAKYIAAQTGLPLVTVRIDGMVSSYLGNTSKNIRSLFEFVEKNPCILFLDEFDAMAKMRDDSNELGELKRVVNALLQNIDSIESKVPVIAATNHEQLLDPAIWRRFDYKIKMELPNAEQRLLLIKEFLKEIKVEDKQNKLIDMLVTMSNGLSGAEIESLCTQIKTNLVIENEISLNKKHLMDYFIKFKNRNGNGDSKTQIDSEQSKISLAKTFKQENDKLFTIRDLSEMTGISTGKLSQELNKNDDGHARR